VSWLAWSIVAVYAAGWAVCTYMLGQRWLSRFHENSPHRDPDLSDRWFYLWLGSMAALFWPFVGLAYGLAPVGNVMRSDLEHERERDEELYRLRAQVREYKIKGGELL